jgi:hypothetical protein
MSAFAPYGLPQHRFTREEGAIRSSLDLPDAQRGLKRIVSIEDGAGLGESLVRGLVEVVHRQSAFFIGLLLTFVLNRSHPARTASQAPSAAAGPVRIRDVASPMLLQPLNTFSDKGGRGSTLCMAT